jgi:hypothetical protein
MFLSDRYDTAIFCFPKTYPSPLLFPVFRLFLVFQQNSREQANAFDALSQ